MLVRKLKLLSFALMGTMIAGSGIAATPINNVSKQDTVSKLIERIGNEGTVLVSVGVEAGAQAPGISYSQRTAQYEKAQKQVLASLPAGTFKEKRRFRFIPYMSLKVNAHALRGLASNGKVTSISEIIPVLPTLAESIPIVHAADAWAVGANGGGSSVAILDTGVQTDHPFLNGKVVAEACFSTETGTVTSACPNGTDTQLGTGSATPLPSNFSQFGHGTHVAGIAAGADSVLSGVAPGADIVAIQVFSIESSVTECNELGVSAPCAVAFSDDLVAAQQYVYESAAQLNVAAVNMSLGGDYYADYCDSLDLAQTEAINLLRTINVATVVSSGNKGYTDGISFPACISSAVSVGATTDLDSVASYSNSDTILDLLSPGDGITSSYPGGLYAIASGTSMAAPHVSGAFAILRAAFPGKTVSDIENSLKIKGVLVTDSKNNIVKPRIQIKAAYDLLGLPPSQWLTPVIDLIID